MKIDHGKITDLLTFCVLGIFLGIEKWSGSKTDIGKYKDTVENTPSPTALTRHSCTLLCLPTSQQLEADPAAN